MRTCAKCNHDCHEDAVSLRAALASAAPEQKPETCVWKELENGIFEGCDNNRYSSDFRYRLENPNKETYCPVCGKRVEVKE